MALVSHPSARSGSVAWLSRAPRRIGYAPLCNERVVLDRGARSWSARSRWRRAPGPRPTTGAWRSIRPRSWPATPREVLRGARRPVVGLVPGAEWATKRWGEERYAELAGRLAVRWSDHPPPGRPLRAGDGPRHRRRAAGSPVIDTSGNSIAEALALLARCDLVVGGDTGLVHCARALGRPTVLLFGPTDPARHVLGERERVVRVDLECSPCHDHGPERCPLGHHHCMTELSVSRGGAPGARPARGGSPTRRRIEVHRMIRSMTGFGAGRGGAAGEVVEAEVRSVNHKFCEVKARLPREMASLETDLVRQVKDRLARGGMEFSLRRTAARGALSPRVDAELAAEYARAFEEVRARLGLSGQVSLSEVLAADGVVTPGGAGRRPRVGPGGRRGGPGRRRSTRWWPCGSGRGRPWPGICEVRLAVVEGIAARLAELSPRSVEDYRARLHERVAELSRGLAPDPVRLATEVALFADRTDVTEELTRLASHVAQMRGLLASGEPAGRKMDFLVQEMHREANTVGLQVAERRGRGRGGLAQGRDSSACGSRSRMSSEASARRPAAGDLGPLGSGKDHAGAAIRRHHSGCTVLDLGHHPAAPRAPSGTASTTTSCRPRTSPRGSRPGTSPSGPRFTDGPTGRCVPPSRRRWRGRGGGLRHRRAGRGADPRPLARRGRLGARGAAVPRRAGAAPARSFHRE